MSAMIKVIASPGIRCPMEDRPKSYITDAEVVEVPQSAYYLRRISDGDLLSAPDAPAKITLKGK